MSNILKRFTLLAALIVAVLCAGVFAACGDQGETQETTYDYSITVVYPDGKAVDGTKDGYYDLDPEDKQMTVQWCVLQTNGELGICSTPLNLGANGKAGTNSLPALGEGEKYEIHVNKIPQGYVYETPYITTTSKRNVTITLKAAN